MLKLVSVIAVAALLLLSELFTWRPEAAALIGAVGIQSGAEYSLLERADCDTAGLLCEQGKTLLCAPGGDGPECKCEVCTPEERAAPTCPKNPRCCARPGTSRVCPVTGYCECPQ